VGQQSSVRIRHNTCTFHTLAYRLRAGISAALLQEQETTAHWSKSVIRRNNISLTIYKLRTRFMNKLMVIQLIKKFQEDNIFKDETPRISE
jgi:hypothetical protein